METLGFNHWAEGSRIGAIGKVTAAYLADLWSTLSFLETQLDPSTARGIYLDRIGATFGVTRQVPQTASTLGKGPALKWTNNTASSVTIPAGTRVWGEQDATLAFTTTSALTLASGQEGYVDLVAIQPGEDFNVGVGTLTQHNTALANVTVTNVRPIGGGSLAESDAAYRFRILNALQSRHGSTRLALEQHLLKLPGVRDVLVRPGARGNGSIDILIIPVDRYLSPDLLAACKQEVAEIVAAGISWRVTGPVTRRVDVRVQLRMVSGTTVAQVRSRVDAAVRAYLDNLRINDGQGGSELIYNELISRIQDASPEILDSAVTLTLDGVPTLQTNLVPEPGERLVSGGVSIA
jgi:uncharacterized phage protein gp47/JayE